MVVHHFCNFVYTFVFDCDRKLLISSVFLQIFLLNRHKKGTKIESGEKKNLNDTPGKLLSLKCHKNWKGHFFPFVSFFLCVSGTSSHFFYRERGKGKRKKMHKTQSQWRKGTKGCVRIRCQLILYRITGLYITNIW